jgi:hypothetical protein
MNRHSPPASWIPPLPRAAAKAARSAATSKPTPPASVHERAGAALLEASAMESVLDRILVKRLRPLRADATAARKAFEQELADAQQRRSSWFRRRSTSVRMQEA